MTPSGQVQQSSGRGRLPGGRGSSPSERVLPLTDGHRGEVAVRERLRSVVGDRSRQVRWAIAMAIAAAGICYSSWVLEFVLPIPVNPVRTFLSELDARGRAYAGVFSAADAITGVLALVAGVAGLYAFSRRRLSCAGWVALAAFGASTIADAQWPLHTCKPDPCPPADDGLFPQLHQIHALTSTLAVTAIFVAMFAFSAAAFRYRRWPILRHAGWWILIGGSAVTIWMLIADNLPGNYALGIAQRIQVGSISLWLVALAVQIFVADRARITK